MSVAEAIRLAVDGVEVPAACCQAAFDEISTRYSRDPDFQTTVERYMGDFERLLKEAEAKDRDGRLLLNYLTSETGRVYLMLAHASGRLN